MLPLPSLKLGLVVVVLVAIAATGIYVNVLKERVVRLEKEVEKVKVERDTAVAQVLTVTSARDEVAQRQQETEAANAKLRKDLARARGRVQTITIPSKCEDALNWLAEELK